MGSKRDGETRDAEKASTVNGHAAPSNINGHSNHKKVAVTVTNGNHNGSYEMADIKEETPASSNGHKKHAPSRLTSLKNGVCSASSSSAGTVSTAC